MRTRFLNTDYFASSSSETLGFLILPVPDIISSRFFCPDEEERFRFGCLEDIHIQVCELPIEAALSKFLFDVVPDHVDAEYGDFESNDSSDGGCCPGDTRSSGFGDSQCREEQEDAAALDNRDKHSFQAIQFETPEMDFGMEKMLFLTEEPPFPSEVLETGNELVNSQVIFKEYKDGFGKSDIILHKPDDIQQNIYVVDYVSSDYFIEKNASFSEEECCLKNKMCCEDIRVPLLEVDEISLTELSSLSMENKLVSFLQNIESQKANEEHSLIDGKDLIGSMNYDLLEFLSDGCCTEKGPESDGALMDMSTEMDIISILETSNDFSMIPVTFEEFEVADMGISEIFEVFICLQRAMEPQACDWMFTEGMKFKHFTELVVSPELALTDDTFKSLPAPIMRDHEKIRSLGFVFEDILLELKHQPLSASDNIYLDWHLLEEDNSHAFPSYNYIFKELDSCSIDFTWESLEEEKWASDFIFSDDAFSEESVERGKESLKKISTLDDHPVVLKLSESTDNPWPKPEKEEHEEEAKAKKASSLFKSLSAFDDLAFFLNPQKAVVGENTDFGCEAAKTVNHQIPSSSSNVSHMSSGTQSKTHEIIFHSASLSDNIVAFTLDLEKSYLTLLQGVQELILSLSADKLQLLSIPKERWIDCIRNANVREKDLVGDDRIFTVALLLAIKQLTWYMCFFGIHVAHLYLNKLCQSLEPIRLKLQALCSSIAMAQRSIDIEITRSHPSLAIIQGILHSDIALSNSRVLILAEQVFWSSLKRLLISMGLSYDEHKRSPMSGNQTDTSETMKFKMAATSSLPISDCLLVSHEQVSPSFPLGNFSVIIEYGGSYDVSRIQSLFTGLASFPRFHFIKVEMDGCSACGALCKGVDMTRNLTLTRENNTNTRGDWLEELLNFVPLEGTFDTGPSKADKEIEYLSIPLASGGETQSTQEGTVSGLKTVIVVNTQSFDKEMIISRRSTYQKVLAMEKEGVQVVERDSDVPVDLMVSPAICLLWYDCQNIGKKNAGEVGASTSLLFWIENIATNVLTSLSFTFSSCIVVFEGGATFLANIMESSDELYAAAASLGISLQIFCSSSIDLTDEIILRCIKHAAASSHCLNVKMHESETLAESFLTKFPSVNPLTGHAILSSGGTLIEFLKLPHGGRVQRVQKYDVPHESIELFSALCRYGAREDSRSVMTDSSSSISSGPDCGTRHFNDHSVLKKQNYIDASQKMDTDMDNLLHFEPLTEFSDTHLKPSRELQPRDFWTSGDLEIFNEQPQSGSSLKDMLWRKHLLDFAVGHNLPGVYDARGEVENWNLPQTDEFMSQRRSSKFSTMDKLDWHESGNSESPIKDYKGEVVNIADSPSPGEGLLSTSGLSHLPSSFFDVGKDVQRKQKIARRLSFDKACHPSYPTTAVINSNSDVLVSVKDPRKRSCMNDDDTALQCNDNFPSKRQKSLLKVLTRRSTGSNELPFREEISYCGGTPLSNALQSSNQQKDSPWTIEFLNRVRERSRTRQMARPSYVTSSSLPTPGNVSNATKRKSPSILEFFKYKGGKTPTKSLGQKRQKQSTKSSSSKNEKYPTLHESWTPFDKRAKRTLSFAMNGTGSQIKLVWN